MAYNNNNGNNTIHHRKFYALYIGPNDNGNSHLIFKLPMKQILVTMKYQIYEHLIEAINEEDSFHNKIQTNHFNSDHLFFKIIILTTKMTVELILTMRIILKMIVIMN